MLYAGDLVVWSGREGGGGAGFGHSQGGRVAAAQAELSGADPSHRDGAEEEVSYPTGAGKGGSTGWPAS
uniref:Uncharacterized protein n=1 Tax=Oryza sativa subsp. japonica TaxID=39947 RepID=Q6ZDE1_ORYSJ|nr:hypothetical protein [Oryza sativa Japonica Group]